MTTDQATARTITTDGITITAVPDTTNLYTVTGSRVAGVVDARLDLEREVPVTTTWFGSRTDPANPPIEINGALYVGHYAMTAGGRYVGAVVSRLDDGKVTDGARTVLHVIATAVADLHATPERIRAAKITAADSAIASAERDLDAARAKLAAARHARVELAI